MFAEMEVYEGNRLVCLEINWWLVRAIFWVFFVLGGKAGLSCAFVLQGIDVLENNGNISKNLIWKRLLILEGSLLGVMIAIPVYSAIMIAYTGFFFKEIE